VEASVITDFYCGQLGGTQGTLATENDVQCAIGFNQMNERNYIKPSLEVAPTTLATYFPPVIVER